MIIYDTTTIGININTTRTLDVTGILGVTGDSTFTTASSTGIVKFANDNIGWRQQDWLARKFAGKRYIILQAIIIVSATLLGIYFVNKDANMDSLWIGAFSAVGVFLSSLFVNLPLAHLPSMQKEFIDYLNKGKNRMVILLEDIDRANDAGIHFLETLSFLLRDESFKNKRVVIIATIGKGEFSGRTSSYEECLDFMYFSQLSHPNIYKFVDDAFDENIFSADSNSYEQIIRFLAELIDLPDGNMRKIKLLLRDATIIYEKLIEEQDKYDWRMIIVCVAMKYFKSNQENFTSFANLFQKRYIEIHPPTPFSRLFLAIVRKTEDLNPGQNEHVGSFKFDDTNSSLPVTYHPKSKGQKTTGIIGLHYKEIMEIK